MICTKIYDRHRKWLWTIIIATSLLGLNAHAQSRTSDQKPLQKSDIREIIDSLVNAYETHYVYPDTAKALGEYIRKRFSDGAYDDATDLRTIAARLCEDMRSFTHDKHLYVSVMSPNDTPAIGDTATDAEIARRARSNFGIRKAEWLKGNVGYLRSDRFDDAVYAGKAAAAAMNFCSRCDAVIIDLRYNGGGDETMVRFLASYFFRRPTLINALYFPENDSLSQTWTSACVPGQKMVNTDLYILTSKRTASGAEAFSYGMKNAGRAVIVGETTAGAAHWTESWEFPSLQIRADIPIARPINPVTKTSWERTGVTPDITVAADDALIVAHREAVKRIIERTTDEERRGELAWDLVAIKAEAEPVRLTPEMMLTYTGEYADGRYAVTVKSGALYWCYTDGTDFILLPVSADLFGFDDTDDYRVAFIRDHQGNVTGFRLLVKGGEPGPVRERTGDIH